MVIVNQVVDLQAVQPVMVIVNQVGGLQAVQPVMFVVYQVGDLRLQLLICATRAVLQMESPSVWQL